MAESHEAEHNVPHSPEAAAPTASPFSPAEVAALHEDDRVAAGHIVKLMVGIFLLGVVIYSIVDLICVRS